MQKPLYRRLVVKVGTNVLTGEDGLLQDHVMRSLTEQIAELRKQGVEIIVVSSGAMAAGRSIVQPAKKLDRVAARQLLASVGQVELIHRYAVLFKNLDITTAQVLATKEDFRDRQHYLNMRSCLETLIHQSIIPIINENDVVSVSELMFTDNDELAGLVASMMGVDALILMTNVDGVCTDDPRKPDAKVIHAFAPGSSEWKSYIHPGTSQFGRGGMLTKCATAQKLSALGIATHIVNGTMKDVLTRSITGEHVGTVFQAAKHTSSTKRWIADSQGQERGSVHINECAVDIITSKEKAASLLPVGITNVEGDFEKGDLIRICDHHGKSIGVGIAAYGAERAKECIGKKGEKALVHYDYLFLSHGG